MQALKPGWRRVKFGEVVRQVKDRVDPATSGLTRYVAGEHMDSDDLRIRRWGDIGDDYLGPAFHMRFRPGHVLYGSRRTYLRKVAVADFEGICANTTFVMESADPKALLPELLPFIMQTEAFHEHSKRESKGSVNPYVNFSDLAWYELALPPLEEQRRIASLLQSVSALAERHLETERQCEILRRAYLFDRFSQLDWSTKLENVCSAPVTYGIVQAGPNVDNGIPYIRVSDMTKSDELSAEGMLRTSEDIARKYKRSEVNEGDLVVALRGVAGRTLMVPSSLAGANLTQGTARVRPSATHNPRFLLYALQSDRGRMEFRKKMRGWKGESLLEITLGDLREILVPTPLRRVQDEIVNNADTLTHAVRRSQERYASATLMAHQLINAGLGLSR